ncbi:hypothetical protein AQUSIP_13440 [Aquicella siphonis]|uniref:Protein required for attachment to host cells n=1 Tax=Aquicella siphonis TaxID=254247 RepID=A0A5E4PI10_9COXI|nr:host attachment protein [Aquicella siphonis]VVC76042.1 hypothetical protein AQUSIP_13440 [Aquicella siphonis]
MGNTVTWLLIADASKARLYSMHKARFLLDKHSKNLNLIGQFTHDASRMKGIDLVSDRMGTFGNGSFEETTLPKVHEAEQFALELLGHLKSARVENSYRDIIIVAPPSFMGLLHKHMPHEVDKLVVKRIEKDYTQYNGEELAQNLINHL